LTPLPDFRKRAEQAGSRVACTAYGYHGTGILVNGSYQWQSYTPYLQGFAKMRLEDHAVAARKQGINATVFNCPEILTNSSALFLGVELSLYPCDGTSTGGPEQAVPLTERCKALLADVQPESLMTTADDYLGHPLINERWNLRAGPSTQPVSRWS